MGSLVLALVLLTVLWAVAMWALLWMSDHLSKLGRKPSQ